MAYDDHQNGAWGVVLSAPSPAISGSSLTLQAGDGSNFPAVVNGFECYVYDPTDISNGETVRVGTHTAGSDVFSGLTRNADSRGAKSILAGWHFAAGVTKKVITDLEAGAAIPIVTTTRAGIQAAFDAHPGATLKWPDNLPFVFDDSTPITLTPTHNNTRLIVPASSPWSPVASSASYNAIVVTGTATATTTTITRLTRAKKIIEVVSTSGFVVGDMVEIAVTSNGGITVYESEITLIPNSTTMLTSTAMCFNGTTGTVTKITPVVGLDIQMHCLNGSNTGTGTSMIGSAWTRDCRWFVKGQGFGGSVFEKSRSYRDKTECWADESGNDQGVGDYGDFYDLYSTAGWYDIHSRQAQGFGPYLSHCHGANWRITCHDSTGRGFKRSTTCGVGCAEIDAAGTTGNARADHCHETTAVFNVQNCNGFGDWQENNAVNQQTFAAANTDIITAAAHGLQIGQAVCFTTTVTLPAGLSPSTVVGGVITVPVYYFVIATNFTTSTFSVSTRRHGSIVDITDTGTGVHSLWVPDYGQDIHEFGFSINNGYSVLNDAAGYALSGTWTRVSNDGFSSLPDMDVEIVLNADAVCSDNGGVYTRGLRDARVFAATNYYSSASASADWVVASGDVKDESYIKEAKRLRYFGRFEQTTIANTPVQLRISLPYGLVVARAMGPQVIYCLDNSSQLTNVIVTAAVGDSFLSVSKIGGGTFTNRTDLLDLTVEAEVEVY